MTQPYCSAWCDGIVLREIRGGREIEIESFAGGKFKTVNKGFTAGELVSFKLGPNSKDVLQILPTEIARLKDIINEDDLLLTAININQEKEEQENDDDTFGDNAYLSERFIDEEIFDFCGDEIGENVSCWGNQREDEDLLGTGDGFGGEWDYPFAEPGQTSYYHDDIFGQYEEIADVDEIP